MLPAAQLKLWEAAETGDAAEVPPVKSAGVRHNVTKSLHVLLQRNEALADPQPVLSAFAAEQSLNNALLQSTQSDATPVHFAAERDLLTAMQTIDSQRQCWMQVLTDRQQQRTQIAAGMVAALCMVAGYGSSRHSVWPWSADM